MALRANSPHRPFRPFAISLPTGRKGLLSLRDRGTPRRTKTPPQPILEPHRPASPTTTLMPDQPNWLRLLRQAGVQVLAWIGLMLLIRSVVVLLQVSGK